MAFFVREGLGSRCDVVDMTDKNPDFLDEADDIYEESDMADDYLSFSHFASANEVPESSADAHSSPSSATSLPALTANNHRDFTRLRRAAAKSVADYTAQGYASSVCSIRHFHFHHIS